MAIGPMSAGSAAFLDIQAAAETVAGHASVALTTALKLPFDMNPLMGAGRRRPALTPLSALRKRSARP